MPTQLHEGSAGTGTWEVTSQGWSERERKKMWYGKNTAT